MTILSGGWVPDAGLRKLLMFSATVKLLAVTIPFITIALRASLTLLLCPIDVRHVKAERIAHDRIVRFGGTIAVWITAS